LPGSGPTGKALVPVVPIQPQWAAVQVMFKFAA
jgi:hypothetical protein